MGRGRVAGFTLDFVALGEDDDGDPFGACVVEPDLAAAAPPRRRSEGSAPGRGVPEAFNEVMIAWAARFLSGARVRW